VKYVGDKVCAGCHQAEAATYQRHSMGRSMALIGEVIGREDYGPATKNPYERFGYRFLVERSDAQVFHELILCDEQGKELIRQKQPVSYVVGSGERGRAYLVELDGRLYQSPINWFSRARRWDMAPNASGARQNDFFGPITRQCVFCHAGRAEPIETAVNRYTTPVFKDHPAIGCERCHGPGELHARRQAELKSAEGPDETIVNPARLEPALREAVCQQCHLQGEVRVERRGRGTFDYRPGLPLQEFWSVFVRAPAPDDLQLVGQVEQMVESRCYRASSGALGCISCHDPHVLPEPEVRVAHYRQRCLACHERVGCKLSQGERQSTNGDNCIACHMPRIRPGDVAHTAVTDHRLLRRQALPSRNPGRARRSLITGIALASFFAEDDRPPDGGLLRDLAVALLEARASANDRSPMARIALPYLDVALGTAPDDLRALEARGEALQLLGRREEALAAFELVLRLVPDHEASLRAAANLSDVLQRPQTALTYWRQAQALDRWSADTCFGLAKHWARQRDWEQALDECKATLRLAPAHLEARMLLVRCAIQSGNRDLARKELTVLLAQDPPQKEQLRQVLQSLAQESPAQREK
jgi:predicted CXXCH cytochrome family protein